MILFRYLTRETLVSMFAVSFTLLVIVMSGRLVKYLAQAAAGDLAPEVLLSIMLYRVPSFLELVLPLGMFIGILLAYGRLYVESEMTVMSACGMSTRRLSLYTLVPSLFVAAVVGYTSLVASPYGISKVQDIFQDAKNTSGLETLVAGRFRVEDKTGRVTYIERLSKDQQAMQEVFSAEPRMNKDGVLELSVTLAEQGSMAVSKEDSSRFLVLSNGYRYLGEPGQKSFQVTEFEQFAQRLKAPTSNPVRHKKTDARSTKELLEGNTLEDRATLQWRISLIILVPIIALIAQALSKTDHRRGRYVKMLPAFLIYVVYLVLLNAARDAIEKDKLPVELGMWWVHGIFLIIALLLLFGADLLRKLKAARGVSA